VQAYNAATLPPVPLDAAAPASLVYPVHPPLRAYQLELVRRCVRHNTLVCLPTGTQRL
jgi:Fanconi anemia group M protein/ATP-dependent DNA helicase MPH1